MLIFRLSLSIHIEKVFIGKDMLNSALFYLINSIHLTSVYLIVNIKISAKANQMGRRLPANTLTLSQFVLRKQTLSLYKEFVKLIIRTDNKELKDWIRHEFKDNMHHKQQVCYICVSLII